MTVRGVGTTTAFLRRRGLGTTARLPALGVGGGRSMTAVFLLFFFRFFGFNCLRINNKNVSDHK